MTFDVFFCVFGQRFERVIRRFAEGCFLMQACQGIEVNGGCFLCMAHISYDVPLRWSPDDARFNFYGPHGALFRACMVPVYYVSLVNFAKSCSLCCVMKTAMKKT